MARPTDWEVLDLDRDPVPGDPVQVRRFAGQLERLGDDAARAERDVRAIAGDSSVLAWIGQAGDVYRGAIGELPEQLGKLTDSYHRCADALTRWAGDLETCQAQADRALEQGRQARADLARATAALEAASGDVRLAQSTSDALDRAAEQSAAAGTAAGASPPDPAQVRAATSRLRAAEQARSTAQGAVGDAQQALELAKQLAADAAALRDDAGERTARDIGDAAEAGIPPSSWWEEFTSALGEAWDAIITIAKFVVAILGIVVLIIGGPLAWVVLAAAILVLADTLARWMQGKASLWDVAFAALDCIPGAKGITSLGKIAKGLQAAKGLTLAQNAARAGRGLLRTGRMLLGEPALALRQFASNPAARLERMALQVRHMSPIAATREGLTAFSDARRSGQGVWASLQRMEGAHDWKLWEDFGGAVDDIGRRDPARGARLWQGGDGYYGVDRLENVPVSAGERFTTGVVDTPAGLKGYGGFSVPDSTVGSLGGPGGMPAPAYNQAVQVGPNFDYPSPYRGQHATFEATSDMTVARGTAEANPQFGAGGATQSYHPDLNPGSGPGSVGGPDPSFRQVDPPSPFTHTARSDVDLSGVRTVNEAVGVRRAMHAPWRAYGYVTDDEGLVGVG